MWYIQGFETKEEAKVYQKKHGGLLCWEERTPKRNELTERGREYVIGTHCAMLDTKKYPYAVITRQKDY